MQAERWNQCNFQQSWYNLYWVSGIMHLISRRSPVLSRDRLLQLKLRALRLARFSVNFPSFSAFLGYFAAFRPVFSCFAANAVQVYLEFEERLLDADGAEQHVVRACVAAYARSVQRVG
eukprot:2084788-Rhodomonas_salina.1